MNKRTKEKLVDRIYFYGTKPLLNFLFGKVKDRAVYPEIVAVFYTRCLCCLFWRGVILAFLGMFCFLSMVYALIYLTTLLVCICTGFFQNDELIEKLVRKVSRKVCSDDEDMDWANFVRACFNTNSDTYTFFRGLFLGIVVWIVVVGLYFAIYHFYN